VPPCGPDVLFVLDSTGSVRNVYEAQRGYILDVVQQMDIASDGQHVCLDKIRMIWGEGRWGFSEEGGRRIRMKGGGGGIRAKEDGILTGGMIMNQKMFTFLPILPRYSKKKSSRTKAKF